VFDTEYHGGAGPRHQCSSHKCVSRKCFDGYQYGCIEPKKGEMQTSSKELGGLTKIWNGGAWEVLNYANPRHIELAKEDVVE